MMVDVLLYMPEVIARSGKKVDPLQTAHKHLRILYEGNLVMKPRVYSLN